MSGRSGFSVILGLMCTLLLGACGGAQPGTGGGGQPLPTPQQSVAPAVQGTVSLVTSALVGAGFQVIPPVAPYRPSEPASLTQTPRVVLQVASPDADQGYVVIYDLPSTSAASVAAADLARYVGSGFGQTNFPTDAQFSVAQVGTTVVFTWYSGARADDAARAREAFDAVASVGQQFPVTK